MSLARRLARSGVLALLIVTALTAAHQHRLAPAQTGNAISQAESVAGAASRLSDCAVCRVLRSSEPAPVAEVHAVIGRAAVIGQSDDDLPVALPLPRRSPRGPPLSAA
ncbi:MAG TPA: hypothetical protein VMS98_09725 [Thermoanaerobaculia bacterium]|nr:hypothetical protein [Thermoanaerobaculia bacterium]